MSDTEWVVAETENSCSPVADTSEYSLFAMRAETSKPMQMEVLLNGKPVQFEIDTGAALASYPGPHITVFPLEGLVASYPGPFTRAVRAVREIRAWYQSFAHV